MTREEEILSARRVETVKEAGRYADGSGLYLLVEASGAKRWCFLFRWEGKLKEMGLGGMKARAGKKPVSLAEARAKARKAREILGAGRNPIVEGIEDKLIPTFGEAADRLVEDLKSQWRNEKHREQWAMTLREYAAPIRARKVDEIDTEAVLSVLKPIWQEKPETASRLRGRIERVLDAAKAKGERQGENPARWRGHLDHLLPARQKLSRGHHAAMPFDDLPAFVASLREREAVSALGLEFLILTAARSGEVLGARWDEVDIDAKVWTVPAGRMKAGKEHRVPLSARAVEILQKVKPLRDGDYVFPGQRKAKGLSIMAFEMLLRRMGADYTTHGFRSAFRDWAGEATNFPRDVAEQALAHAVGDATERAYRRGDALEKRRKLMDAWANYCAPRLGGVVRKS